MAKIAGKDVAGIGGKMSPDAPTAWLIYIASSDAADTAKKAKAAGGSVMMEPQAIGPQGTMAVIQDPPGGAIGVGQAGPIAGSLGIRKAQAFWSAQFEPGGFAHGPALV